MTEMRDLKGERNASHSSSPASMNNNKKENIALRKSRSEIDQPTRFMAWILLLIVPSFYFDHTISNVMYAFGYEQSKISNIWFLRDQYEFLKTTKHMADLNTDPFHVFELFVWFSIAINVLRLAIGVFFLGYSDDARSKWRKRNVSGRAYFFAFLVCGPGGLIASALAVKYLSAPPLNQHILAYSPKAFIGLEAYAFCVAAFLCGDGVLTFLQLMFGDPGTRECKS